MSLRDELIDRTVDAIKTAMLSEPDGTDILLPEIATAAVDSLHVVELVEALTEIARASRPGRPAAANLSHCGRIARAALSTIKQGE